MFLLLLLLLFVNEAFVYKALIAGDKKKKKTGILIIENIMHLKFGLCLLAKFLWNYCILFNLLVYGRAARKIL